MLTKITFFQRFEADILAAKKTITIRDESERDFAVGSRVEVATFETNRKFCDIEIQNVEPVHFDLLSEQHAQQENMTLERLKAVIREIYPGVDMLYVISFKLI